MNLKELTNHIRNRIKHEGVNAKVKMDLNCGKETIRVDVPKYDVEFSEEEQRVIRMIAKVNGMTRSEGLDIDVDRMTDPKGMVFYVGK